MIDVSDMTHGRYRETLTFASQISRTMFENGDVIELIAKPLAYPDDGTVSKVYGAAVGNKQKSCGWTAPDHVSVEA